MRAPLLPLLIAGVLGCSSVRQVHEGASCVQPTPTEVPSGPTTGSAVEELPLAKSALMLALREARGASQQVFTPITEAEQAGLVGWLVARLGARATPTTTTTTTTEKVVGVLAAGLTRVGLSERPLDSEGGVLFSTAGGHGLYFVRETGARPLIVEVPHRFSDLHTLQLGARIFRKHRARALLVNGTNRRNGCTSADDPCPADVAHAASSVFEAFNEALAVVHPGDVVLQIHGFDQQEGDPLLIVSAAGTRTDLSGVRQALAELLGPLSTRPIAVYPTDIDRLGGVTSTQARFLREVGGRMVHIELARSLRERLRADDRLLSAFVRALAVLEEP